MKKQLLLFLIITCCTAHAQKSFNDSIALIKRNYINATLGEDEGKKVLLKQLATIPREQEVSDQNVIELQQLYHYQENRHIDLYLLRLSQLNAYYLIAPEVELNHGYYDLFLMPDLMRYDMNSYILERYVSAPKVRQMVHNTKLHASSCSFVVVNWNRWRKYKPTQD